MQRVLLGDDPRRLVAIVLPRRQPDERQLLCRKAQVSANATQSPGHCSRALTGGSHSLEYESSNKLAVTLKQADDPVHAHVDEIEPGENSTRVHGHGQKGSWSGTGIGPDRGCPPILGPSQVQSGALDGRCQQGAVFENSTRIYPWWIKGNRAFGMTVKCSESVESPTGGLAEMGYRWPGHSPLLLSN